MKDLKLLMQPLEALASGGERHAQRSAFALVPASADPTLETPLAHLVHLRRGNCEQRGRPEPRTRHQRSEPDAARLRRQRTEREPRVERTHSPGDRALSEVVVRKEQ